MLVKVITVTNACFLTIGFLIMGLQFQSFVCNSSHDLTMLCLNISDIALITFKNVDYRCIFYGIKSEAINLSKNCEYV